LVAHTLAMKIGYPARWFLRAIPDVAYSSRSRTIGDLFIARVRRWNHQAPADNIARGTVVAT